eukprot:SAG11_NODE_13524_length_651_cov_1.048913_1_plen_75_part_00
MQTAGRLQVEAKRAIPLYNDKHLAYTPEDAAWVIGRAALLGVPLWAASAMPVVWRAPAAAARALDTMDEPIEEA